MQFLPVSATETVIREISYALPDAPDYPWRREMRAARYLNWRINRRVNAEDTELITRVQLGMQSPAYVAGPLATSEVCLRSFASKLRRLIPEARLGKLRLRAGAAAPAHEEVDRQAHGEQRNSPQGRSGAGAPKGEARKGEAGPANRLPTRSLRAAIAAAT